MHVCMYVYIYVYTKQKKPRSDILCVRVTSRALLHKFTLSLLPCTLSLLSCTLSLSRPASFSLFFPAISLTSCPHSFLARSRDAFRGWRSAGRGSRSAPSSSCPSPLPRACCPTLTSTSFPCSRSLSGKRLRQAADAADAADALLLLMLLLQVGVATIDFRE